MPIRGPLPPLLADTMGNATPLKQKKIDFLHYFFEFALDLIASCHQNGM